MRRNQGLARYSWPSWFGKASILGQAQTGLGPRLILLLTQTAVCPDQMLAVMVLSQHRVSSFKTVRPGAPCSTDA